VCIRVIAAATAAAAAANDADDDDDDDDDDNLPVCAYRRTQAKLSSLPFLPE